MLTHANLTLLALLFVASAGAGAAAAAPDAARTNAPELAFVSIRTGDARIFTRNAQGVVKAVTDQKGVHSQPAWASNNRLAFLVRVGPTAHLFVTDTDGGAARRLTTDERMETSPSWSPDGQRLAFYSKPVAAGETELIVVDMASSKSIVLGRNAGGMGPTPASWSADSSRLAFEAMGQQGRMQIWVAQSDGSNTRNVSLALTPRGGASPNLSPDGRQVLWVANLRGRAPVVLTDVESGVSKELTPEAVTGNETPRWSPDGRQIVFSSLRDSNDTGRNDVFVMNADGSQVRNLSRHENEDFDAKWSADGRSVVFASLRSGTSLLYEVDLADGVTRPLTAHASHDMDHVVRPMAVRAAVAKTTQTP